MASIGDLAQHLLTLNPQFEQPRLCFYNYLKNLCDLDADLTPAVIKDFFFTALHHHHWQQHPKELEASAERDLRTFLGGSPLSFMDGFRPGQSQLVAVNSISDMESLTLRWLQSRTEPGDRWQTMDLPKQRMLVVQLTPNHHLNVAVYSNVTRIQDGMLFPLPPVTQLYYNSLMELDPGKMQTLELSPLTTARFKAHGNSAQGVVVNGHLLQKSQSFSQSLSQLQPIFFALKALERQFIEPQSDSFYQELVELIEQSSHAVEHSHAEAYGMAQQALKRGKLALQNIFVNDKLLRLLVSNLEFQLNQGPQRQKLDETHHLKL